MKRTTNHQPNGVILETELINRQKIVSTQQMLVITFFFNSHKTWTEKKKPISVFWENIHDQVHFIYNFASYKCMGYYF